MGTPDAQLDGAPIAVVRTTADFLAVLKKRIASLGISYETANAMADLSDGYIAKLLGPRPSRRLGSKAFDGLLRATRTKLLVVPDDDAMEKGQLIPRRRALSVKRASPTDCVVRRDRQFMRQIGQRGGFASGQARRARALQKKALSDANRTRALKRWRPQEIKAPGH
jgi:hypothetical protein